MRLWPELLSQTPQSPSCVQFCCCAVSRSCIRRTTGKPFRTLLLEDHRESILHAALLTEVLPCFFKFAIHQRNLYFRICTVLSQNEFGLLAPHHGWVPLWGQEAAQLPNNLHKTKIAFHERACRCCPQLAVSRQACRASEKSIQFELSPDSVVYVFAYAHEFCPVLVGTCSHAQGGTRPQAISAI